MPYKIIMQDYSYIQYKLLDFITTPIWEEIDCRTETGKDRYYKLFNKKCFLKTRMTHRQRRKAGQKQLTQYLPNKPQSKLQQRKRRFYKRQYNPAPVTAYKRLILPVIDNLAIESNPGYQGSLYQIFLSANLEFFAQWQQEHALTFQTNECQVEDIIRLELARIRLGFPKINNFLNVLATWHELQVECGVEHLQLPSHAHYLKILTSLGSQAIKEYFLQLQAKCERLHLFSAHFDAWDGRFLYSYNSGQKLKAGKEILDLKLGEYVYQSKYFGIGYLESRIINGYARLPKYYEVVNPQWNDNQTLQFTFKNMIADTIQPAEVILADGGPKGKKSRDLIKFFRSIPIFAGPKNAAGPTLITKKSRIFYAADVPPEYELILDKTYDLRTLIEQSFSYDSLTYNLLTVPHRLPDLVDQFIGLVNCQALLTALAAVYTDQFHLISSRTAFRYLSLANQNVALRHFIQLNADRN